MSEYIYTIDLGKSYGERLEMLAAWYGCENSNEFAAILLSEMIEKGDMRRRADLYEIFEAQIDELLERDREKRARQIARNRTDNFDDGIPL